MKDNEIIKVLECCYIYKNCNGCPQVGKQQCLERASLGAIDLINRQKAEIEKLKESKSTSLKNEGIVFGCDLSIDETKAETVKRAKAEAVKEFMSKLERRLANNTDISSVGYQSIIFDMEQTKKETVGEG